jgi:hypothetical protein
MVAASRLVGVRKDLLADPEDASGAFKHGGVVELTKRAGAIRDAIDTFQLGELPATYFQVLGEAKANFAEQVRQSEIGLSGALPGKQVRATELVQSQGVTQGLDESVFEDIEDIYLEKLVTKIFHQGLSFASSFNDFDLAYIFANNEEKIAAFKEARKNKSKLFDELAYTFRFRGKGIRGLIARVRIGQAALNIIDLAVKNPLVLDILEREGYNIAKVWEEAIRGFNIHDPEKLKDPETAEFAKQRQQSREVGRGFAQEQAQLSAEPGVAQGRESLGPSEVEPGNNGEALQ